MSWVLDSSTSLCWCFVDQSTDRTDALLERMTDRGAVVPQHWGLEVANGLRSAVRRGKIAQSNATDQLKVLLSFNVRVDSETSASAFGTIYELSRKYKLSVYDAAYLELAHRLGLALATNDRELIVASKKIGVELL